MAALAKANFEDDGDGDDDMASILGTPSKRSISDAGLTGGSAADGLTSGVKRFRMVGVKSTTEDEVSKSGALVALSRPDWEDLELNLTRAAVRGRSLTLDVITLSLHTLSSSDPVEQFSRLRSAAGLRNGENFYFSKGSEPWSADGGYELDGAMRYLYNRIDGRVSPMWLDKAGAGRREREARGWRRR